VVTVMVVPADRGGCGHYRLIWPAQAVSAVRPDWEIAVMPTSAVRAGFNGDALAHVDGFPDPLPDLLVCQRVGTAASYRILQWAKSMGVATVVDFDDAMWAIDRDNSAYGAWNSTLKDGRNPQDWRLCDSAAAEADLVTVTTEALARRYARHGRVEVIPNAIPRAAVDLPKQDRGEEPFTAGWAGFTATHPGDVAVSAPAARCVLGYGGRLRVVADAAGAAREWQVPEAAVDAVPPQRLGPDYYRSLSGMDLMLVGLRQTRFNNAKSTLKVLEAASQGVPSIAPDNPPHRALARSGFPLSLAGSASEWHDHAEEHIRWHAKDPEDRANLVWAAVLSEHTIEGNAERWARAWERAMARAGR